MHIQFGVTKILTALSPSCLLCLWTKMLPAFIASATLQNALLSRFQTFSGNDCNYYNRLFCFSVWWPSAARGESTNLKRLLMQQYLRLYGRYNWSYDLCWRSWRRQRSMLGNRIIIRMYINKWTISFCYKQKKNIVLKSPLILFQILSVQCPVQIDNAVRYTNTTVDIKSYMLIYVFLWIVLISRLSFNGSFWN